MLRLGTVSFSPRSALINVVFEQRLAEFGYHEGRNFVWGFIQISSFEEYEAGFRELVAGKVDIIFHVGAELGLKWALKVTTTLPIVLVTTDYDPLAHGYVTSLARPSGNITGGFPQQVELANLQGGSSRTVDSDHVLRRVIGGSMESNERHCRRVWIAARRR